MKIHPLARMLACPQTAIKTNRPGTSHSSHNQRLTSHFAASIRQEPQTSSVAMEIRHRYSRPRGRCVARVVSDLQTSLDAANCPENSVLEQLDFNFCWFDRNGLVAVAAVSMGVALVASIEFKAFTKDISQSNEYVSFKGHSSAKLEHRGPISVR